MRRVRRSRSYNDAFQILLEQGLPGFGLGVVEEKRERVENFVREFLAHYPSTGTFDAGTGYFVYPVSKTPFVLIYDFDDAELRLQLIVHNRADRSQIDPTRIVW